MVQIYFWVLIIDYRSVFARILCAVPKYFIYFSSDLFLRETLIENNSGAWLYKPKGSIPKTEL